jgi:hypothetical protein
MSRKDLVSSLQKMSLTTPIPQMVFPMSDWEQQQLALNEVRQNLMQTKANLLMAPASNPGVAEQKKNVDQALRDVNNAITKTAYLVDHQRKKVEPNFWKWLETQRTQDQSLIGQLRMDWIDRFMSAEEQHQNQQMESETFQQMKQAVREHSLQPVASSASASEAGFEPTFPPSSTPTPASSADVSATLNMMPHAQKKKLVQLAARQTFKQKDLKELPTNLTLGELLAMQPKSKPDSKPEKEKAKKPTKKDSRKHRSRRNSRDDSRSRDNSPSRDRSPSRGRGSYRSRRESRSGWS